MTKPTPVHGEPKVPVRLVETDTDVNPVVAAPAPEAVTKTDLEAVKELAEAHDQIVTFGAGTVTATPVLTALGLIAALETKIDQRVDAFVGD